MNTRPTNLLGLITLMLVACGGVRDEAAPRRIGKPPAPAAARALIGTAPPSARSNGAHQVTRTIDEDPDGDGIANRRIIVTDSFDDSGMLVQRIRERDFEADGIIDARDVTHFDDAAAAD
jgi:hypothetical protein